MRITALLGLSALMLAAIFVIASKASVTANSVSTGMSGIDTLAITMAAKPMPEQQFAAF